MAGPPASTSVAARRWRRWLLLGGVAVCLGYFAAELWVLGGRLGFPLDDSWIHLQFARNLAAGRGLSYNPGELVIGSTAPLWTAILALLFALPGDPVLWTQLLGTALFVAGIGATYRLARELDLARGLAALAAGLTLGTAPLVWSALSGMEVPLFVLLSLGGMILHLRERRAAGSTSPLTISPAVFALACLARPEGFLLLLLALGDRCLLWARRPSAPLRLERPPFGAVAAGAALAACVLLGPLLFYRLAGGSFLPTTFAAKGGELRHWLPSLQYVYMVLGILLRGQPYMTLLGGAGVLALLERLGTLRDRGLLPALWVIALPLAYSTLSPEGSKVIAGNFGRYYFPLFPPLVVLGTLGIERAAAAVGRYVECGRQRLPLRFVLLALLLWPSAAGLLAGAATYERNLANVEGSDGRAARWLAARLPPAAVLAVNDIGAFKYFLPNRIVDLAGIVNPELRREVSRAMAGGASWDQAMTAAIARRRPDYVAVFPSWVPGLARDPRFQPVLALRIPDNVTMGSDLLVIYGTPWTLPAHRLRRLPGDG